VQLPTPLCVVWHRTEKAFRMYVQVDDTLTISKIKISGGGDAAEAVGTNKIPASAGSAISVLSNLLHRGSPFPGTFLYKIL
jgi:hypothetical protein